MAKNKITGWSKNTNTLTMPDGTVITFDNPHDSDAWSTKNEFGQVLRYYQIYGKLPTETSEIGSIQSEFQLDRINEYIRSVLSEKGYGTKDTEPDISGQGYRNIRGLYRKDLKLTINGKEIDFTSIADKNGVEKNEVGQVLQYLRQYGELPKDKLEIGSIASDETFNKVLVGINEVLDKENRTLDDIANDPKYGNDNPALVAKRKEQNNTKTNSSSSAGSDSDYNSKAFDQYYLDAYDKNKEGSLSKETYDNLLQAEINAGQNAMDVANLQTQKLAMDQARTVKSITDSLRSERMAMLRSGMSESQIANQDMQILMNNTNALNQQIMQSNAQAFAGQQQINDAQTNAYNNWLGQMNQVAQVGAQYSAANAGDVITQAQKLSLINGKPLDQNIELLSGQSNNK